MEYPNPFPELNQMTGGAESTEGKKKTWAELHQYVKNARKLQAKLTNMVPGTFTFREVEGKTRLYFLGVPSGRRENTIMYCDINFDGKPTPWRQLLDVGDSAESGETTLSKEEQLLQERKRSSLKGLSSYAMHTASGRVVFPSNSRLHTCVDSNLTTTPLPVSTLRTVSEGSKLDAQICPSDPDLIAYVSNGDIWLYDMFNHVDNRLTFSKKGPSTSVVDEPVSSGLPSYIIQEEFDRYTGYWWQPTESHDGCYRILYEEVDESCVDVINIISPTSEANGVEHYRYPRAGTTNATCTLKLLEINMASERKLSSCVLKLHTDLRILYPWCEYVLRIDWMPDGQGVWTQIMDRSQRRLALVLIPLSYFVYDSQQEVPEGSAPRTLHEETSNVWINVDSCLQFMQTGNTSTLQYIWASERTGFKHLYRRVFDLTNTYAVQEQELTSGDWQVSSDKPVHVDAARQLVYFNGNKDGPLETHLYCVSIMTGHIQRLTQPGSSHQTLVDQSCSLVLSTFSSIETNPACQLYKIVHDGTTSSLELANIILEQTDLDPGYEPPQLIKCSIEENTEAMYSMVYKPHNYRAGCKYPTVLYVYGGPQVQMVVNSNRALRLIRLHTLASLGYVVVCLDSRGSIARGLQWESHIKDRMGTVEISDQVTCLQWLADKLGFIDMSRIAIHGWSYGGYMALMGLAQRPDIFKVSISGAPVTKWEFYDTGYTERYMSTPTMNSEGYKTGSVLSYIDNFPNEENRLLLIHGMIDENVHLVHTTCLVNELIKHCKPYRLQLYPNERHGIRNPEAGQHFETMVLSFLQDHL